MVGWSGRLGTVTGCSVRVRAPKVWKTLSAKEGGYVNMWLHTCNNTVSTFYTHCWTPGSWGMSESAFICLHSLIWLSVCLLAASRQHVHSYCNSSGTFKVLSNKLLSEFSEVSLLDKQTWAAGCWGTLEVYWHSGPGPWTLPCRAKNNESRTVTITTL